MIYKPINVGIKNPFSIIKNMFDRPIRTRQLFSSEKITVSASPSQMIGMYPNSFAFSTTKQVALAYAFKRY